MAHHSSPESDDQIPPQPSELKKPHQPQENTILKQEQEDESDKDDTQTQPPSSSPASKTHLSNNAVEESVEQPEANMAEDSGRERLKRHRVEVAGNVWIPDIWGQEERLKDWMDCTTFDAPLVPSSIMTARTALVEEGREKGVEFSLI